MKTVILAGGFGTRISEETGIRPKPMVEIGNMPVLWHIMKMYSARGFNEFIICAGYKAHMIKSFFANYYLMHSDISVDLKNNNITYHKNNVEPWKVTIVDTGLNTMTGGRIRRIKEFLGNERFFLTYGDGVCDIDFHSLLDFHLKQKVLVSLTAVQPPGRFGAFSLDTYSERITSFREKPKGDGQDSAWINGGFFVVEPEALDAIKEDDTVWEREPLEHFAQTNNLAAFKHNGYWQNMDTLHDKNVLEDQWNSKNPPWKKW